MSNIGPILLSDVTQLAEKRPREAQLLAEILDLLLGKKPKSNYMAIAFITAAEKETLLNVYRALTEAAELCEEDRGPAGILHLAAERLQDVDSAIHDRFMKYLSYEPKQEGAR